MGIVKSSERWEDEFELLFQQQQPSFKKIRHRSSLLNYDLLSLPILSPHHHEQLTARLTQRQTRSCPHLLDLVRCFHTSEENYCGSRDQLDLIYEESAPTLEQFLTYRRTKHEIFSTEEVLCVVKAVAVGLRELKQMGEEHGFVLPANVVVKGSVKLRDPILIEEEQRNNEMRGNGQRKVRGFPSPQKLYTYFDTLTHFQEFTADLFSLGILALQLIHPHHNMQSLYNAATPAHNIKLDFNRLQQFKEAIPSPQLREAVYALTDPLTGPRVRIYALMKGWSVDERGLKLLRENPFVMEENEEKRQVTLIEELAQSQADREGRAEKLWDVSNAVQSKFTGQTLPPIFQSNITFAANQHQQFQPQYKQNTPSFQYPTKVDGPLIGIPSIQPNSTVPPLPSLPSYPAYSSTSSTFKINSTPIHHLFKESEPPRYVQSSYKPLLDYNQPIFNQPAADSTPPPTNPTANYQTLFADTKSIIFAETTTQIEVNPLPAAEPAINNSTPVEPIHSVVSSLPQQIMQVQSISHDEVRPPIPDQQPKTQPKPSVSPQVELPEAPIISVNDNNASIVEVTEHDNSNEESEFIVEQYEIGTKYEGYKRYGKRNGRGKFFYKEGSYYDGEWKDNKMDGFGILYYPNGTIAYEGEWKDDEFHGKGTVYNDDPAPLNTVFDFTDFNKLQEQWVKYEGELRNDCKEGIGRLTLTNGQIYEGEFMKDLIHGEGIFTRASGKPIHGYWNESHLKKLCK